MNHPIIRSNFMGAHVVALSFCLFLFSLLFPHLLLAKESLIVGRIEAGILLPENVRLKIKMDTGATVSSLHAQDIEYFTQNNQSWVRFTLQLDGQNHVEFTRKIVRTMTIKKRRAEIGASEMGKKGTIQKDMRPVVLMDLCLNDKVEQVEVNLADRSHFIYPMLLGREAMEKFGVLIEPTESFITKPTCHAGSADEVQRLINHR